jgi:26S proteasome regulatory subunit T3
MADIMETDAPVLVSDATAPSTADEDLYTTLKNLQRQLEFLEIQEDIH